MVALMSPTTHLVLSALSVAALALGLAAVAVAEEAEGRWVHPLCQPLKIDRNGPFGTLADGALWTVDADGMRTSGDDGQTWSEPLPICKGLHPAVSR